MMSGSRTTASHHMMFQKKDMNHPHKAYEELNITVMLSILLLSFAARKRSMKIDERPARIQVMRPMNTGIVFALKNSAKTFSGLEA